MSSTLSTSSRLMSGSVLEIETVAPSSNSPASSEPGSSSKNMSLSGVCGRIRIVASR